EGVLVPGGWSTRSASWDSCGQLAPRVVYSNSRSELTTLSHQFGDGNGDSGQRCVVVVGVDRQPQSPRPHWHGRGTHRADVAAGLLKQRRGLDRAHVIAEDHGNDVVSAGRGDAVTCQLRAEERRYLVQGRPTVVIVLDTRQGGEPPGTEQRRQGG